MTCRPYTSKTIPAIHTTVLNLRATLNNPARGCNFSAAVFAGGLLLILSTLLDVQLLIVLDYTDTEVPIASGRALADSVSSDCTVVSSTDVIIDQYTG